MLLMIILETVQDKGMISTGRVHGP